MHPLPPSPKKNLCICKKSQICCVAIRSTYRQSKDGFRRVGGVGTGEDGRCPHQLGQALLQRVSAQDRQCWAHSRGGEGSYCLSPGPSKRTRCPAAGEQWPVISSSREIGASGSQASTKQISTAPSCREEQVRREETGSVCFLPFRGRERLEVCPLLIYKGEQESPPVTWSWQ